jgi:Family of unknown function (DUF6069)
MTMKNTRTAQSIGTYLLGGLIAGVIAAVIANIYFLIFSGVTGYSYAELNIFSVTMASILPSIVGSLVYFGLTKITSKATAIFTTVGILFGVLSTIPSFIAPPNPAPGFALATAPLHVVVAVVCVIVVPLFVRSRTN